MKRKTFIPDLGLMVGWCVISPIIIWTTISFINMAFEEGSAVGFIGFLLLALYFSACYYVFCRVILRFLTVTDQYIVLRTFCHRTVRIKYENIKDIRIKTLSDAVYHHRNHSVDADTWIAITETEFESDDMRKIRSSRKKKTLKYHVRYEMCKIILENLKQRNASKKLTGELEYMIFRYDRNIRL